MARLVSPTGLSLVLLVGFVALKLTEVTHLSWWWTLAIPVVVFILTPVLLVIRLVLLLTHLSPRVLVALLVLLVFLMT